MYEYRVVRKKRTRIKKERRGEGNADRQNATPFVIVLAVWSKIFSVMLYSILCKLQDFEVKTRKTVSDREPA